MKINRFLRIDRKDINGRVPIHLRVCWQSNKIRLSSGEKVRPTDWDGTCVRVRVQFSSAINMLLDTYESGIRRYAYQQQINGVTITPDLIRAEIERIRVVELGKSVSRVQHDSAPVVGSLIVPTLQAFILRYIQEMGANRSTAWRSSVAVVATHLNAFRTGISWEGLNLSTLNLFKVYLQDKEELSDATISAYVGLLRGLLDYAGQSGMPLPPDRVYLRVRPPGRSLQAELTADELRQLMNSPIPSGQFCYEDNGSISRYYSADEVELTRWYFLISCHTGLRHSDLWMLQNPKISYIEETPCLEIHQRKTAEPVVIPLSESIYHLLHNPPIRLRPASRIDYNTMIRIAAQYAELNRMVCVGSYYQGQLVAETLPLYQTISSHMGRRTFATLMTAGGMPTRMLQEIMGHASISSTERYVKVSNPMIVRQTLDIWQRLVP